MNGERVWLYHPETGGYFECPVAAADDWMERGWKAADAPPQEPNPALTEYAALRQRADQPTPSAIRRAKQNGESDG